MSKYKALLGLAKEVLPSGERVLIREGDDILRSLKNLDERDIENLVSEMDARSRARDIKKDVIEKVSPSPEIRVPERMKIRKEFHTPDTNYDESRAIGGIYFPKDYDSYLNLDEINQLSKQYGDSLVDSSRIASEKRDVLHKLRRLNPQVDDYPMYEALTNGIIPSDEMQSIARERFKKIRDAMKGEK